MMARLKVHSAASHIGIKVGKDMTVVAKAEAQTTCGITVKQVQKVRAKEASPAARGKRSGNDLSTRSDLARRWHNHGSQP